MRQEHHAVRLLREAGPTISMRETATILRCSVGTAYAMHGRGELAEMGVRVLRAGRCLRVATASLRRALDIDDPQEDTETGGAA